MAYTRTHNIKTKQKNTWIHFSCNWHHCGCWNAVLRVYSAFVFHNFRNKCVYTDTHTAYTQTWGKCDGIQIAWILYEHELQLIDYSLSFKFHSPSSSISSCSRLSTTPQTSQTHTIIKTNTYAFSDAFHPFLAFRTVAATNKLRLRMRLFNIIDSDTTFTSSSRLFSVSTVVFIHSSIYSFIWPQFRHVSTFIPCTLIIMKKDKNTIHSLLWFIRGRFGVHDIILYIISLFRKPKGLKGKVL